MRRPAELPDRQAVLILAAILEPLAVYPIANAHMGPDARLHVGPNPGRVRVAAEPDLTAGFLVLAHGNVHHPADLRAPVLYQERQAVLGAVQVDPLRTVVQHLDVFGLAVPVEANNLIRLRREGDRDPGFVLLPRSPCDLHRHLPKEHVGLQSELFLRRLVHCYSLL